MCLSALFVFCEQKIFKSQRNVTEEKEKKEMALKRSALKAMGLTDEQIESVIEMHTDTVTGLKDKLDVAESGKESSDKLKADYDKLKADYDAIKQTIAENEKYKEVQEKI